MLVVGDKEMAENAVNVRKYGEQKSETMSLDDFIAALKAEVRRN
jgi:threonyl-tRNA synthetase